MTDFEEQLTYYNLFPPAKKLDLELTVASLSAKGIPNLNQQLKDFYSKTDGCFHLSAEISGLKSHRCQTDRGYYILQNLQSLNDHFSNIKVLEGCLLFGNSSMFFLYCNKNDTFVIARKISMEIIFEDKSLEKIIPLFMKLI
ncbi:MAG: hypothetical protein JJV93_02210 [Alphaproteobacteria bacterium]|nr:hypothetical protein [Alphaproteobacteria bacterium]MBL0718052.1 hypothetical protein [Alphaproteobacteria bacterium]